jgi:hypothetical protein
VLLLQLPGQPLVVQSSGEQFCEAGVEQLPLPLQKEVGVKVEPEQVAARHIVLVEAFWQAPPLQRPVFPQVPLAGQRPCGSAVPFPTLLHVPRPFRLQTWQGPQAVTLQQAPSTQLPLPHSWSAPQVPPRPLSGAHVPPVVQ